MVKKSDSRILPSSSLKNPPALIQDVTVRAFAHPLKDSDFVECSVPYGMSIADILHGVPTEKIEAWMNGIYVQHDEWERMIPGPGSIVIFRAVPQHDVLRAVLEIGLAIALVYLTAGTAIAGWSAFAKGALILGANLGGTLLINALVPPAQIKAPADSDPFTRLASLTGQTNQVARFVPIPRVLGKMKYFPPVPMTGTPYTYIMSDNQQYIKMLLILGYGPLEINGVTVDNTGIKTASTKTGGNNSDPALLDGIFIGGTALSQFSNVNIEVGDPQSMTIYSQSVTETRVDLAMNSTTQVGGGTTADNIQDIRTTEVGVDEIGVDFEFPNGLFSLNDDGSDNYSEVNLQVEYRLTGSAGAWTAVSFITYETYYETEYDLVGYQYPVSDTVYSYQAQTKQTVRRSIKWPIPTADASNDARQYDIRVTRLNTYNNAHNVGSTDMTWLNVKSFFKSRPFDVPNVVGLALDIQASDKLSGTIDNISVLAQSVLPVWNGTAWVNQATSSPAWCYNEVLTGEATKRPLDRDTAIDLQALMDWDTACTANGFEFNAVIESSQTVFDTIRTIAAAGRAAWGLKNNLISVIREETEQTPKQLFSPRNATNFKLQKVFPQVPHALRVQFVDPTTYEDTERLVYDDGYSAANATIFEELQIPGVTSADQAWKLGRFHLAQMRLRPETWTFEAHIDQLIAQRGDAIGIMADQFLDGLNSGRIKTCNGGNQQVDPGFESGTTTLAIQESESNTLLSIVPGIVAGSRYALRIAGENAVDNVVCYGRKFGVVPGQVVRLRCFVARDENALPAFDFVLSLRLLDAAGATVRFTGITGSPVGNKDVKGVQEVFGHFLVTDANVTQAMIDLVWGSTTVASGTGAWLVDDIYIDTVDSTSGVSVIEVDDTLYMDPDGSYKVSVRYVDASGNPALATVDVNTVSPSTKQLTCITQLPDRVYPGDLFVFGTTPVTDAKITKISPTGDDFTATITAVPLASAIITADQLDSDGNPIAIPDYNPLLDTPVKMNSLPPPTPTILSVRSDDFALVRGTDGVLRAAMQINFWFPPGQPKTTVQARYSESGRSISYYYAQTSSDDGKLVVQNVVKGVSYDIQLQATNINGLKSAWSDKFTHTVVGKKMEPSDVTGFSSTIEDYGIVLSWNDIPDLDRSEYEIRIGTDWDSASFLWRGKGTHLRTGIETAGTMTFLVKAIDASQLYSVNAVSTVTTITAPTVSNLVASFVKADVKLAWTGVQQSFSIREYEIRRGGTTWDDAEAVTTSRTNVYRATADWSGDETWRVAAIDVDGNVGPAQSVVATVALPTIQSVNPQVIDNNVLLRWSPIAGTLPIDRYEIRKGDVFDSAELIGTADTTFSPFTESQGGTYTYWVAAIDTAGNVGTPTSVQTTVNEPPDFVLQTDFYSDGFGDNTNVQRISEDFRSIQFGQTDGRVVVPEGILNGKTNCTQEFRVAFDDEPAVNVAWVVEAARDGIGTDNNTNTFKIYFGLDSSGNCLVYYRPYSAAGSLLSWSVANQNLFDGRHRMYSFTRDQTNSQVTLYIDGISQGVQSVTMQTLVAVDLVLGNNLQPDGSLGLSPPCRMDEVRFWADLRTATEIADFWNEELTLAEDNLTAYFRFNLQGNQITADDISPSNNDGNIFADQNLPVPTLLIPFPSTETVNDRNTVHGYTTPQAQVTAGYPYVAQPVPLTASIEEVYNAGTVLPGSRIQVLQTLADIVAGVTASVTISTKKLITDAWTAFDVGLDDVYATDFQYVKTHIDYTAATAAEFASLTQLATKGFVKLKTDEGDVVVSANPTAVTFSVAFVDVKAITATGQGTTFLNAIIDFQDVPNPTGFNVYTFDANGNAVTGRTVHWIARGV